MGSANQSSEWLALLQATATTPALRNQVLPHPLLLPSLMPQAPANNPLLQAPALSQIQLIQALLHAQQPPPAPLLTTVDPLRAILGSPTLTSAPATLAAILNTRMNPVNSIQRIDQTSTGLAPPAPPRVSESPIQPKATSPEASLPGTRSRASSTRVSATASSSSNKTTTTSPESVLRQIGSEVRDTYTNVLEITNSENLKDEKQSRSGCNQPFPYKVHLMLEAHHDCISWCPHGRAFVVHNREELATVFCPTIAIKRSGRPFVVN